MSDDTTTGQPAPGGEPDSYGFTGTYGNVSIFDLTPEEEARRAELEAAAREFGEAGWRVIPLWHVDKIGQCTCPKAWECASAGKHPLEKGWQDSATTEPPWWREGPAGDRAPGTRWPTSASRWTDNTFVLDEDPDNGGDVTLAQIQERLGDDWEHARRP